MASVTYGVSNDNLTKALQYGVSVTFGANEEYSCDAKSVNTNQQSNCTMETFSKSTDLMNIVFEEEITTAVDRMRSAVPMFIAFGIRTLTTPFLTLIT